jgi:hypothetical protein
VATGLTRGVQTLIVPCSLVQVRLLLKLKVGLRLDEEFVAGGGGLVGNDSGQSGCAFRHRC